MRSAGVALASRAAAVLLIAIAFLAGPAGCGSAAKREKTIHATLVAVNAARDGFVAYNRERGKEILDSSPDRQTFEARLAAYYAKRQPVLEAFTAVYQALVVAALANEPEPLSHALELAAQLFKLLETFQGKASP